jgi:3-hydroxyisobutyrate dehydrogenase-like beta-hydroxyacid dehydrogenase
VAKALSNAGARLRVALMTGGQPDEQERQRGLRTQKEALEQVLQRLAVVVCVTNGVVVVVVWRAWLTHAAAFEKTVWFILSTARLCLRLINALVA